MEFPGHNLLSLKQSMQYLLPTWKGVFFVNVDFDVLGQSLGLYTPQRDKGTPACVEEQILQ